MINRVHNNKIVLKTNVISKEKWATKKNKTIKKMRKQNNNTVLTD